MTRWQYRAYPVRSGPGPWSDRIDTANTAREIRRLARDRVRTANGWLRAVRIDRRSPRGEWTEFETLHAVTVSRIVTVRPQPPLPLD